MRGVKESLAPAHGSRGVRPSTRKLLWCGQQIGEYFNASNVVQMMLFVQGQYQNSAPYFYMRDHLGSIREMTDAGGTVVARYDYDPWGRSTTVIGTNKPDFNFTGLYQHAKSGLDLAVFRAYNPDLGRWLSRDPIAEDGGLNLYGYVGNNPITDTDPLGLEVEATFYVESGQLTMVDRERSAAIVAPFESGKGECRNRCASEGIQGHGPLPRGRYRILNRGSGNYKLTGFKGYMLIPIDSSPNDDIHDPTGRANFRLHQGRGIGCVTSPDRDTFGRIQDFLQATSTSHQTGPSGNQTYFGILNVVTSIYSDQP